MTDLIEVKEKLDTTEQPIQTASYEQLEDLKKLIKCAKRMSKGGFKKCIPNGIQGLLFKSRTKDESDVAVRIDPEIWTMFLKYDIRLKVETPF